MYKLDVKPDAREEAMLERRRQAEESRKARFFNAKTRQIGIDVAALDQQIQDKRQKEENERMRHEAYATEAKRNDMIASLLAERENAERKRLENSLNEFRAMHQQPQSRREFDLYDPDRLKKDRPARINDEDPRLTLSGMQRFDGEDLNREARTKYQQQQSSAWWQAQEQAAQLAKARQRKADILYDLKRRELDQRAVELARAEEECRKAIKMATDDFNKALAEETEFRRKQAAEQEENDKMTELANMIFGDMLSENPDVARSAFGPNRITVDRWKGMSKEELQAIRETQAAQVEERAKMRMEQEQADREWDRIRVAHARAAELLERESDRARKGINERLTEENARMANEQKRHQEFLDKEVYTNEPTAAYFSQFNTGTR